MERVRAVGAATPGGPGGARALVHQRHRRDGHGPARTIHDFYGFPQPLFDLQYPAPGLPELSEQVADVVSPTWVGQDIDSWGIDHGTWSVLVHAFPDASIPVVQLSVNADKPVDYHLDLGARLAPLRQDGVLVLGSGNIVHNLHAIDRSQPDTGFDWAHRFDRRAREVLLDDATAVTGLDREPDWRSAVPTPDHFLPLLYLAGLAAAEGCSPEPLVDGYAAGSISMAAYALGADPALPGSGGTPAAALPQGVPADGTNL